MVEPDDDTSAEVERVFRDVAGQAVVTLVRNFGDIGLAEDAVQDAFVAASRRWPTEGIPANPAGWIVTTARNRAIDQLRRTTRGRELTRLADTGDGGEPGQGGAADRGTDDEYDDRLAFGAAVGCATSDAERRHLERQLSALT